MAYMQLTADPDVAAGDMGAWEAAVEEVATEVKAEEATPTVTSSIDLIRWEAPRIVLHSSHIMYVGTSVQSPGENPLGSLSQFCLHLTQLVTPVTCQH